MNLNKLSDRDGSRKARSRPGRGMSAGRGKTSGRGHKGQKSRSGVAIKGFEGGQMPITRRLPKRGFHNIFRKRLSVVNVGRLQAAIDAGKLDAAVTVTAAVLVESGLVRRALDGVRLLGQGELSAKVTVEVHGASKAAIAAVEKAGGKITLLAPPRRDKSTKKGRAPKSKFAAGGNKASPAPKAG